MCDSEEFVTDLFDSAEKEMKALKMHTQKKGCFQTSLFSFFLTYKFFTPSSVAARCVFEAKRQSEISSTLIRWMKQEVEGRLISVAGWCFLLADDWQKLGIWILYDFNIEFLEKCSCEVCTHHDVPVTLLKSFLNGCWFQCTGVAHVLCTTAISHSKKNKTKESISGTISAFF